MSENFIILAAMFGFMYFLLIRPQKKQMESRKRMIENLSVGDKISTIGGIKGEIKMIMGDSVILEIAENVQVELVKTAIGQVLTEEDEYEEDSEDLEEVEEYEEEHESENERSL